VPPAAAPTQAPPAVDPAKNPRHGSPY
jgi:hypothetical protein